MNKDVFHFYYLIDDFLPAAAPENIFHDSLLCSFLKVVIE